MVFGFFSRRRREALRAASVPETWRGILERNVPIFRRIPAADQLELFSHVSVFLAEKNFEGCAGLELSEEIRVTVAGQACLLLLHRETDYYPRLQSILIYPSTYFVGGDRPVGGGVWTDDEQAMLGHTQQQLGALVLAWDSATHGATRPHEGENLVLHEFAHQLDFEDGVTDGTPLLRSRPEYIAWGRVMSEEFAALRDAERRGEPTVLDTYGATNPAEFFAVVTEAFFERPTVLRDRHLELYTELRSFFKQDPASFPGEVTGAS